MATTAVRETGSTISMKEMVERSGLSEHTLRYYERIGLLDAIARDRSSRHRHYSERDVMKVVTLACLRATGMSIEQMRRYFDLNEVGADAAPEQIELFERHRDALRAHRARIEVQLRYLDGKVAFWRALGAGEEGAAREIGLRNVEMALEINNQAKEEQ
jgi:MerR family transcriptional regulator, aldehyde-responsive regulator